MRLVTIIVSVILFMFLAAPVYKQLPKPLPLPRAESPSAKAQIGTAGEESKEGFLQAPKELRILEVNDPEKDLPVQIRNITAVIENTSEDTFTSVVVNCSFGAGGEGTAVSKQAVIPNLGPKERKSATFSFNTSTDFGGYARFTGYDPAGALRYDTPVNLGGPKVEIISATKTSAPKQETKQETKQDSKKDTKQDTKQEIKKEEEKKGEPEKSPQPEKKE